MLLLCRLVRSDAPPYKGLPQKKDEKLQYAKDKYKDLIRPHFVEEEKLFSWVARQGDQELFEMSEDLIAEHKRLHAIFQTISIDSMDKAGRTLEEHIRHEERVYFQKIQEKLALEDFKF